MELQKIVIVSGGTNGIGEAVCKTLHKENWKVYNLDILEQKHSYSEYVFCDISNYENVKNAIGEIIENENRIDAVFSNAGIHLMSNLEETTLEDFHKVLSVNFCGTFYLLKSVLPFMKKQKFGKIVLNGSEQCFIGKANSAIYGATKGAVGQLTKSTAIDCAPFNIQVNAVCPGTTNTPLVDKFLKKYCINEKDKQEKVSFLENAQLIKRMAKPEEIASLVSYLLSDKSDFITGSLMTIDGGYTCE
ncbi:SDR family NAD(P)-dependent oxidoreductase [Aureivirga sp. CE67]|uniref:SDR family NAD(P)-dependent oxidoreductase n=1 Tax=Aureivirga sp. CE67 TaxID=1788983 RepID=UPI0018CAEBC2|nr:SDR family oxidoreductase [Aureivirga sp. CE67]